MHGIDRWQIAENSKVKEGVIGPSANRVDKATKNKEYRQELKCTSKPNSTEQVGVTVKIKRVEVRARKKHYEDVEEARERIVSGQMDGCGPSVGILQVGRSSAPRRFDS